MMAVWGYGLLGPVEVRVDGRVIELASARQRLVLAMLLLDADRLVPAGRLINELWGEALPTDPPAAVSPSRWKPGRVTSVACFAT